MYPYIKVQVFLCHGIPLLVGYIKEFLKCGHLLFEQRVLPISTEFSPACFRYWRYYIFLKFWHLSSYLVILYWKYCVGSTYKRFKISLYIYSKGPIQNKIRLVSWYIHPTKKWRSFPKALVALDILTLVSSVPLKIMVLPRYLNDLTHLSGLFSFINFDSWLCSALIFGWNKTLVFLMVIVILNAWVTIAKLVESISWIPSNVWETRIQLSTNRKSCGISSFGLFAWSKTLCKAGILYLHCNPWNYVWASLKRIQVLKHSPVWFQWQ